MKNASEIKHSLSAVKQTRQITNAMYLLSATEMKRYLGNIGYIVEYMERLRVLKGELLANSRDLTHPFRTSSSHSNRTAFIVISGERGMCGSYNQDIAALAEEKIKAAEKAYVIMKGSYAEELLCAKGIKADEKWEYPGNAPSIEYAADMADKLINLYLSDEIDEIDIVYTKYLSQGKQSATCDRLLPLESEHTASENDETPASELEYLGSEEEVFVNLTTHYIKGFVYSAMYESFLCENISRMNAMRSATNNADEMIKDLTSKFNSIRQLAITSEITEITTAAIYAAEQDSVTEEETYES